MNNIWSLSKSGRYVDRSENLLIVLAVVSAVQIAISFQAGRLLLPTTAAAEAPVMGTELSTNAPATGGFVHAPVTTGLARPVARS